MLHQVFFDFRDISGRPATVTVWVPDTWSYLSHAGIVALRDAIRSCSDAKMIGHGLRQQAANTTSLNTPASAPYDSRDKIRMEFATAAGNRVDATIPAPGRGSTALENDETLVTSTSGPGQDLKNALIGVLCDAAGNVAQTYLGSVRIRGGAANPILIA